MKIGNKIINYSNKPFIIAEVAQAHDGSFGNALAYVDLAKSCGADAVKFQTHIASEESSYDEPWRVKFSYQDKSRYDYWKRMEFSTEQWAMLKKRADQAGLVFLSSPFSVKACDLLKEIGIEAWKISSGEIENQELINCVLSDDKPIIMSTGLTTEESLKNIFKKNKFNINKTALLHCTTLYPTPPEEVGLNVLKSFQSLYPEIPIGISDHSGEIVPAIVATYLGATIIEAHITFDKDMFGPDCSSSLNPIQFKSMVKGVEFAWKMRQNPVDKSTQLSNLEHVKKIFSRSWYTNKEILKGSILVIEDFSYLKPGGGMGYDEIFSFLGKESKKDMPKQYRITREDINE